MMITFILMIYIHSPLGITASGVDGNFKTEAACLEAAAELKRSVGSQHITTACLPMAKFNHG